EQEATRRTNLTLAQWRARITPYVRRIVESGRYPLFTRVVLDAEDFPDPDVTFERRLGYVLDGLPANPAQRCAGASVAALPVILPVAVSVAVAAALSVVVLRHRRDEIGAAGQQLPGGLDRHDGAGVLVVAGCPGLPGPQAEQPQLPAYRADRLANEVAVAHRDGAGS